MRHHPRCRCPGFTLIELLLALVIVAILASVSVAGYFGLQARAEVVKCMGQMRSLHSFAALYVDEHNTWPYPDNVLPDDEEAWGRAWQQLTAPYDLSPKDLVCPTHQKAMGNPDLTKYPRIDYMATPFSGGRWSPYRWSRQPWFIEVGDFHGNGNLVIFPDGHIETMQDIVR